MRKKIKKSIIKWDKKHISSLIEEDIESLAEFIANNLEYTRKRLVKTIRRIKRELEKK